jgi:upstream activation factor subunit UAF30
MATPPKAAATTKAPAKAAAEKPAAKAAKTVAPPAPGDKPNALQKPLTPSPELAEIVGKGMLPRGQVVSKVWEYIRAHNLQNPADKREILADDKLKKVFGRDKCTMFEMNKYLAQHLK